MSDGPGTWHESDPRTHVDFRTAKAAWIEAVTPILEDVASTYGGYLTYDELGERLFARTGYRTSMQLRNWIGAVLGTVQDDTGSDGRPPLSSLVVYPTGGVSTSYGNRERDAAEFANEVEQQQAAAEDRLACYRHYARDVPADAAPTMTTLWVTKHSPSTSRTTPRPRAKPRAIPEPVPSPPARVCPECFMALPATGLCDCA